MHLVLFPTSIIESAILVIELPLAMSHGIGFHTFISRSIGIMFYYKFWPRGSSVCLELRDIVGQGKFFGQSLLLLW
jgi:hypothetical protein